MALTSEDRADANLGALALTALDPRYPGISQYWNHTKAFLANLVIALGFQVAQRQGSPGSADPELGDLVVRAMAARNGTVDPGSVASQIAALQWVLGGLGEIIASNSDTPGDQSAKVPDMRRLQTLTDIMVEVTDELRRLV